MVSIPSWWLQIQGSWVVHAGFWSSNDNFQEKGAFATSARKFYARCGDSCRFTWPCDLKSWGTWHFHNFIIVFTWTNTWYWSYSYLCDSSPIVISATSVISGSDSIKRQQHPSTKFFARTPVRNLQWVPVMKKKRVLPCNGTASPEAMWNSSTISMSRRLERFQMKLDHVKLRKVSIM